MPEIECLENETIEDLQLNGLMLLQKKTGFRFGMDSVLLAHFASIKPDDTVVDFGTGSGVLPLLLIGRGKGKVFYGLEIQADYCEMAERTMKINRLNDRVHMICGDAGKAHLMFEPCSVDAVICNPPYGKPGGTLASPYSDRSTARTQREDMLQSFFTAAFRILKGKGKISIVYPAPQMLEAMMMLKACHLEPKRFQMVHPRADRPANLVLIEGVKDSKPSLQPMKPMIVYDGKKSLTNELKSIYHIAEQNPV